jgi:penicillin amidase
VAPRRTAHGHALLAGDPHLDLTLPSIWYEVHLVVPGALDVYGATIPGAPFVVIGFNRDVAWTFTNTYADVADYYAETVDDSTRPTRYLLDGRWRRLTARVETYRGRRGETLAVDTVYFTHRGPMRRAGGGWLSMRWTVLEPSRESDAFLRMAHARSAREWLDATAPYSAPSQNALVADRAGTIAVRSTGRFPLRPGDGRGDTIRDGSSSASDWTGDWPLARYPSSIDPAQGYLASANQQPVDPAVDDTYLGVDWPSPWRAMRINALLRADSAATPDDLRRFQTDPGSARADIFVPAFLAAAARWARADCRAPAGTVACDDALLARAATLLAQWDRRYTPDNRRAVLFETAMETLADDTWDELARDGSEGGGRVATPGGAVLAALLRDSASAWWDDRRTPGVVEHRDAILTRSLRAALAQLLRTRGAPDGEAWRWDHVAAINIHHLLRVPAFSALGVTTQGGPGTLNPVAGAGTEGASWRMVVELGPTVRAWTIYPGGQSGDPASPWYRDRLAIWACGALDEARLPDRPAALDARHLSEALTLRPP